MTERKTRGGKASEEPRRRGQRAVADLLPAIGAAAFKRFGFVQSSIVSRWPEIVGVRYAEVSAPESIRFPAGKRSDGTLTLTVAGAHAPMMQHITPTIIERVNRFFGYTAVARVTIRQGTMAVREARTPPPSLRPVPADLGDSLRNIADPELRACLSALAGAVAATSGQPAIAVVREKGNSD
ncbi:MAG TPA: DciA family protein [Sphingomonas sp.]|nr:DciA family protein [Sphingomonas sp.]